MGPVTQHDLLWRRPRQGGIGAYFLWKTETDFSENWLADFAQEISELDGAGDARANPTFASHARDLYATPDGIVGSSVCANTVALTTQATAKRPGSRQCTAPGRHF
jgi:hypothetical protein